MNKMKLKWILQAFTVLLTILTLIMFLRTMLMQIEAEREALGRILYVAIYGLDLIPILVIGAVMLFPIQYFLGQKNKTVFRLVFHSLLLAECLVAFGLVWVGMICVRAHQGAVSMIDRTLHSSLNMAVLILGTLVLYAIANLVYFVVTLCISKRVKCKQEE